MYATLQAWLGHEELETTSIYLAKIKDTSETTKAILDATVAAVVSALPKAVATSGTIPHR